LQSKYFSGFIIIVLLLLLTPAWTHAATPADDLKDANGFVVQAMAAAEKNNLTEAKSLYEQYNSKWFSIEDEIKQKSKGAYRSIEESMGEVQFAFVQKPVSQAKVISSLRGLNDKNLAFINGKMDAFQEPGTGNGSKTSSVEGLVSLLDQALADLKQNNPQAAKIQIEQFRNSWLDIEGIVLTQSSKVYADAERDMVSASAKVSTSPPDIAGAIQTVQSMRDYLSPLSGKTSYTMVDVVTILLREGLEALLVVVALLGFLNKSGQGQKRSWIWYGLGAGVLVSVILGVIVQMLFSSGAFGQNNFLIAGFTGLFAAVMLVYMSYWLHSKSSLSAWHAYIHTKSTNALATGSLWSLAILSFLAVFREGTETVLFFIGMASSIDLASLLSGIALGVVVLIILAFLILKIGLKIPMRPFFLVSSILVFYLCFKFLGMGIHGMQLAGVFPATHSDHLPSLDALALYPTWESVIPQAVLLVSAAAVVLWNKKRDVKLRKQININPN
jgi:high-affinity iron transporter